MQGKIALEEHFAIEATLGDSQQFGAHVWNELKDRLLDFQDQRIRLMDDGGIEMMILSLNAPAVQAVADPAKAESVARRANDLLAAEVAKRPDRFAGLAALPMQDPERAIRELERCVRELGFKGALVNGCSDVLGGVAYYDAPQYRPFWAAVEALDVPFYLHPRNPPPGTTPVYDGHSWLMGPNWAFAAQTAAHTLRLIGSGLFDDHPGLNMILGHLGEGIPALLWRIDNRNQWMKTPHTYAAKKGVGDYFRANFHLTTSGNFRTPSLISAMAEIGADRVMYSADYPFEDISDASQWFDAAEIDEADRLKIGRTNALRLFKLGI